MTSPTTTHTVRRPDGPNAGIVAVVATVLTLAGIAISAAIAGSAVPSPLGSTADVAAYYAHNPAAATIGGFFTFGASVPLGIYAATTYARMLRLGARVPGPAIGYYGGIAASVFLGASGLIGWVLGQSISGMSPALVHAFAYITYALGGIGFVGGIGLLIAGAAVPSLILRLTPRWFAWVGLVIAVISELSFFALIWPPASIGLPIGRFAGLLWLIVAGFLLPHDRRDVPRDRSESSRNAA
ncbi:hypothetical protein [Humibacter sp. RRB41]|uniref:hypothetical protein n=1 Tax=Humibacter sp. RRB41 TaxID=2919946 RepID=UPI001FA98632|nr:hypothetical protein [Humibacter sp. RRB41]